MSSLKIDERRSPRGRPRGFNERQALDAALSVFWEKGYRATSMDDLVARTGASRNSLYKTFGDKRDLFLKCLELYGDRFEHRVEGILAQDVSTREGLREVLLTSAQRLTGTDAPPGCLRCQATLELLGAEENFDAALLEANDRFTDLLRRVFERGAMRGDIGAAEAADLALFYTGIVNGMVLLARSGADRPALMGYVETSLDVLPDR